MGRQKQNDCLDLSWIFEKHFKGRKTCVATVGRLDHPNDVNSGDCFLWALIAKKYFPRAELCATDIHAFVFLDGKYYDSDHPRGIKSWKRLKTIREYSFDSDYSSFCILSPREFRRDWREQWPRNLRKTYKRLGVPLRREECAQMVAKVCTLA